MPAQVKKDKSWWFGAVKKIDMARNGPLIAVSYPDGSTETAARWTVIALVSVAVGGTVTWKDKSIRVVALGTRGRVIGGDKEGGKLGMAPEHSRPSGVPFTWQDPDQSLAPRPLQPLSAQPEPDGGSTSPPSRCCRARLRRILPWA